MNGLIETYEFWTDYTSLDPKLDVEDESSEIKESLKWLDREH